MVRINLRSLVQKILKERNILGNYTIIEGCDGVDILNEVIKDQTNNNLLTAILTDENMEFLNGSDAIKYLKIFESKNKIRKIPIASITAFVDDYTLKMINAAGADRIISKPCEKKNLIEFLETFKLL